MERREGHVRLPRNRTHEAARQLEQLAAELGMAKAEGSEAWRRRATPPDGFPAAPDAMAEELADRSQEVKAAALQGRRERAEGAIGPNRGLLSPLPRQRASCWPCWCADE